MLGGFDQGNYGFGLKAGFSDPQIALSGAGFQTVSQGYSLTHILREYERPVASAHTAWRRLAWVSSSSDCLSCQLPDRNRAVVVIHMHPVSAQTADMGHHLSRDGLNGTAKCRAFSVETLPGGARTNPE